ncbi:hypothetical protein DL93DRAFT_2074763 [Clavulina sp. PMI_390]|nr:hypothetical protein DL93DRAFT_2074763 [Clavulina sp. PMI_390]
MGVLVVDVSVADSEPGESLSPAPTSQSVTSATLHPNVEETKEKTQSGPLPIRCRSPFVSEPDAKFMIDSS